MVIKVIIPTIKYPYYNICPKCGYTIIRGELKVGAKKRCPECKTKMLVLGWKDYTEETPFITFESQDSIRQHFMDFLKILEEKDPDLAKDTEVAKRRLLADVLGE